MLISKLSGRYHNPLLILTTLILLYSVGGFWVLPKMLEQQIPLQSQQYLNLTADVDSVQFNPFTLELSLNQLAIQQPRNKEELFRLPYLYINASLIRSVANLGLVIQEIRLHQPYLLISRDQQGIFNFDRLIDGKHQNSTETDSQPAFPFILDKFALEDGTIQWNDNYLSRKSEQIGPLNLTLKNLKTLPDQQSELGASIHFASGGALSWHGQLSLSPLYSSGRIELDDVNLARIWELFLQDKVRFQIHSGSEHISTNYLISENSKGIQVSLDKGGIGLKNLQIGEPGQTEPVIKIPIIEANNVAIDLFKKTLEINEIYAREASFKPELNSDSQLNFMTLFANPQEKPEPVPPANKLSEQESAWQLSIQQLNFNNFDFRFSDSSSAIPAQTDISDFHLSSRDIRLGKHSQFPFESHFQINQTGSIRLEGNSRLDPIALDLKATADNIDLTSFQPYLDRVARLDILNGQFNMNARLTLAQTSEKEMRISVKGDSRINNLLSRDQASGQDFVKWESLVLKSMELLPTENRYSIDTVQLNQPYARILIRKDKSVNLTDIRIPDKKAGQNRQDADDSNKPEYRIGRFNIVDGSSDFADQSLILPFAAHINHLSGSVDNLTSTKNNPSKARLEGKIGNLAPVKLTASLNLFSGNSDIDLSFQSIPMPMLTPYMAEFAGRQIEQGNLSLDLHYQIKNKELNASNNLLIEHLVLGDTVENPEASSLPLELALALLEDSNGKIALDVPITGSLEDPSFSVGSLIIDALTNVLGKLISSPFNAIAGMIDSDQDLSHIGFIAGSSQLEPQQATLLQTLAQALANRPGVKLEIKGHASETIDWPALKHAALHDHLLARYNIGQQTPVQKLTAQQYQEQLAEAFINQFPEQAERSLLGKPRLKNPAQQDFITVAESTLATALPLQPARLKKLAEARAKTIAHFLTGQDIPLNRLFLQEVDINSKQSAVELGLSPL